MAIEYVNRKGKTYYLHEGKTKAGKPKYFFSLKSEGSLVNEIPAGYEIYENPNSQVFLRKIPAQVILPEEVEVVENGIKRYAEVKYFILDVKGKNILVYLCDQNVDELVDLAYTGLGRSPEQAKKSLMRSVHYSPVMQFVLQDKKARKFGVERWCFLGSIDDWILLDSDGDLEVLVKEYTPHLGQESFYDLKL